jgi:hypothetical protein
MSRLTQEGKVASKMVDLLSDIRLDLDLLGMYLAKVGSVGFFLRAERVFQASEETLMPETREEHYDTIRNLG